MFCYGGYLCDTLEAILRFEIGRYFKIVVSTGGGCAPSSTEENHHGIANYDNRSCHDSKLGGGGGGGGALPLPTAILGGCPPPPISHPLPFFLSYQHNMSQS